MTVLLPGTQLETLCCNTQDDAILVAPFVKAATLERLLNTIADEVNIQCVTRWKPDEIIAGVNDLEVWPLLQQRPNTSLWLRSDLHAKYYRGDNQCLIGSANLTATALGWIPQPNLELLISMHADDPQLEQFEAELFSGSIQVNDNIFERMSQLVQLLLEQEIFTSPNSDVVAEAISSNWLPTLRHPEKLYIAYTGNMERLSNTAKTFALSDLKALAAPPGLTKTAFIAYISTLLLQNPIAAKVDNFVTIPQRFGAVRDLLLTLPCADTPDFNANNAWQTLMRWLLYFLPDRYRLSIPHHSEVFYRIDR